MMSRTPIHPGDIPSPTIGVWHKVHADVENGGRVFVGPRIKRLGAMLALSLLAVITAAADRSDAYAMHLGKLINDYRAHHGLQTLALVAPLSDLAREHALQMAREHHLSHDGFQERFAMARSPTCVENVGETSGGPEVEFNAWRKSPAHDHNLLDPRITRMGIAIEGRYAAFFACR